jgi:hypothetical protein
MGVCRDIVSDASGTGSRCRRLHRARISRLRALLAQEMKEVHVYGAKPPPGWLEKLPLDIRFVYHHSRKRFITIR